MNCHELQHFEILIFPVASSGLRCQIACFRDVNLKENFMNEECTKFIIGLHYPFRV